MAEPPGAGDLRPLTAERLFERFFLPLYPDDARVDLARARTEDRNPANNPWILAQIDEAAAIFAKLAPVALASSGEPDLALDFSDASVHHLAQRLTRAVRDAWIRSDPAMLVKFVTHGTFYVGACVKRGHGGVWQVRRPLWESTVRLTSKLGTAELAVFQWWIKALSDEEIDHGRLADRYRTHVEVPTFDPSSLAVIAPADRRLPRLAKVRYDLLFQHLRAHLPELRDLGADFPSPERFEELGLKHLDFTLLGRGRMLLLSGAGATGVHLFWLDRAGFVKAAYVPADPFPAPVVKIVDDGAEQKVRVIFSSNGKELVHEMMWWGA